MKLSSIALMMFLCTFASAQPDDEMMPRGMRERIAERLDLSADQQKQFDKLRSDLEKQQITLRSKIRIAHVELADLFRDEAPDRAKIEAKQNEIIKLQGESRLSRTGFWFDVNKILKPEQQKNWKQHLNMMTVKKIHKKERVRRKMFRFREREMGPRFRRQLPSVPEDDD